MKALADLHVHSDRSDGLNSPQELVEIAEQLELGGIALTDHDTLAGVRDFLETPISGNLQRVPGVEVSTKYLDHDVHLLGYFVPFGESPIELSLRALRESRHTRFPKMVKKLRDLGIVVDESEIQRVLREVASPGRPHLARILIDSEVVRDIKEAFTKYLASGKPAFVGREKIELIEAIQLLRESGAVPVIAHPLLIEGIGLEGFLRKLKPHGLEGVEVNYGYRKPELMDAVEDLRKTTEDLGLIVTGGSDYHGDEGHSELGSVGVPVETIDILRKASERIRSR
ncbi:MAG: PHP domain-containing protein [Candidatus Thorarchaeota archaeon]|nr:PHP domain-containing protein [Candidatus Thorarchaeota archaeon]